MSDKIRLLFVVDNFLQAGAQRYQHAISTALDRDRFDIEVLALDLIGPNDYYYPLHMAHTIPVRVCAAREQLLCRLCERLGESRFVHLRTVARMLKMLHAVWRSRYTSRLRAALSGYDIINAVQIEVYDRIQEALDKRSNVIIHLMSIRLQYEHDPFRHCLSDRAYQFITANVEAHERDLREAPCKNFTLHHFPLAMDLSKSERIYQSKLPGSPKRIAIFTRISKQKPVDMFFYSLQSLRRTLDCTLFFYGGLGDPKTFQRTVRLLGIEDVIVFKGHTYDMKQSLIEDEIDLVWHTGYEQSMMGYAPVEVASYGVPIVFWNLGRLSTKEILKATQGVMQSFSNVVDFVDFNAGILSDPEALTRLGAKLRAYVIEKHEIAGHISSLEDYYLNLVGQRSSSNDV